MGQIIEVLLLISSPECLTSKKKNHHFERFVKTESVFNRGEMRLAHIWIEFGRKRRSRIKIIENITSLKFEIFLLNDEFLKKENVRIGPKLLQCKNAISNLPYPRKASSSSWQVRQDGLFLLDSVYLLS